MHNDSFLSRNKKKIRRSCVWDISVITDKSLNTIKPSILSINDRQVESLVAEFLVLAYLSIYR